MFRIKFLIQILRSILFPFLSLSVVSNVIEKKKLMLEYFGWTEFPLLNDILKKHGAEGEDELGQAQFAHLLQLVLQDIADALAEKHVVVVQNIKIISGIKLRMVIHHLNLILRHHYLFSYIYIFPKVVIQITCFL